MAKGLAADVSELLRGRAGGKLMPVTGRVAVFKCDSSVPIPSTLQLIFLELGLLGCGRRGPSPLLGEPAKYLPKSGLQRKGARSQVSVVFVLPKQSHASWASKHQGLLRGRSQAPAKSSGRKAQGWAPCMHPGEATLPLGSLGHWPSGFGSSLISFPLSQEGLNASRRWNLARDYRTAAGCWSLPCFLWK